ncbi:MAG TPA: amino acid adenylation domain-containing protein [Bacteroidales bacterium]|nr:amino acid adenylation domain-containing protein [Bacteroidales bacterium]
MGEQKQIAKFLHYPLSSLQTRLWIVNQLDRTNPEYNIRMTYNIKGDVNIDALNESLSILFKRYTILFATFPQIDGIPHIEIVPRDVRAEYSDFSGFPEEERRERILEFLGKKSRIRFDIERGPLYSINLVKENDSSYFFHVVILHIIFDGGSERLFAHDFCTIYTDVVNGRGGKYSSDYSAPHIYQEEPLSDEEEESLTEYWKETLKDCPSLLKFPYDFPRRNQPSGFGHREHFQIDEVLTAKLKDISEKAGSSLYMTMVAAIGVLMNKYTGEDDICFGIPISKRRNNRLLENAMGYYVDTAVARIRFQEKDNFFSLVKQVREVATNAIKKSKLSFEKIVEIVRPERISNVNPLYQVTISSINGVVVPMDLNGAVAERIFVPDDVAPFDFTIYIWEDGNVIEGEIKYNTDILRNSTIVRLKHNLVYLVEELTGDPDKIISEISILSESEIKLLEGFNKTNSLFPECLLHELVERQVEKTPDKPAVVFNKTRLSYRELNEMANQLAWYLKSQGVRPGDAIGMCIDRSADMIVTILGILKSGCCYLPFDTSFPDDRILYMTKDADAKFIISNSSLEGKFKEFNEKKVIYIDRVWAEILSKNTSNPSPSISADSLAYIIYTSGSTGRPKGVKVHHRAVVNMVNSMSKKPGIHQDDVLLAVVTPAFDMSVYEIFTSLANGATLVIAGKNDIVDGKALAGLIDEHNVTILQATPSLWNILLSSQWKGRKGLKALCGGEALTQSLVSQVLPKVAEFWNCYGPTETTVYASIGRVTDADAPIVIGKPLDNTKIFILDKNNMPLPVGVIGEVAIGGDCVTKGYNNLPDLTSQKFIPLNGQGIIYKTGDLGRFLEDGNIELFGRIDNQIKLRGFRIEPGEIETLIARLTGVREAVVKLQKFSEGDERLVAFINAEPDAEHSRDELISYLSQHVPGYMVPSYFRIMDGFPRLPNGKIDKKALVYETIESDQERTAEADFATLTETQKKIYSIWSSILKLQKLSISVDFFDAGGNSLLGIRLINQIWSEFGITINFRDLVANSTIAQLSAYLDKQVLGSAKPMDMVHLQESSGLPLTRNQKRIWLISQSEPDIPYYIIKSTYRLKGNLNTEVFEKSLNALFHRHHIVFSEIHEENGEPYFNISEKHITLPLIDFTSINEGEKLNSVADFLAEDSKLPFDLSRGPLFRVSLIKTAPDEHYFNLSIHHIVFDGWSQGVMVDDLSAIYNSLVKGEAPNLDAIEFQQYDYAGWETTVDDIADKTKSIEFWKTTLQGCSPILNFPYDFQRINKPTGRGSFEAISIPELLSDKIRSVSRDAGASLFTTLMAAFGIQMNKYSGDDDLNIGLPIAYRPHPGLENIFGMFVNTVVVRLQFEEGDTFKSLIRATNGSALSAIAHQDLPFEKVVEIVNPDRNSTANPLFQVGFVWQNNLNKPLTFEGITTESVRAKDRAPIFDLSLYLWENGDVIEGEIEYNSDLLRKETILRIRDSYIALINNLVTNPDKTISNLSVATENDIRELLEFNSTDAIIPEQTLHQELENISVKYHDKPAVISGVESLTYKQLDERSNQLANYLLSVGVKPGEIVGIYMERNVEMIVAVLGILKAGCCYLPLDPLFPGERLNFMLEDAGSKVMISQGSLAEAFDSFSGVSAILIDKDWNAISGFPVSRPEVTATPDSFAYIIYTSGSTGRPKGVPITHRSVVNLVKSMTVTPGFSEKERLLAVVTLSFDMSVYEIFTTLLNGATLVVASTQDITNGQSLIELIDNYDISVIQATPSLWNILLSAGWKGKSDLKALCGGEPVSPALIQQMLPRVSEFWNCYGPTEITVYATCTRINDPESVIHIGKPINNTRAFILDKNNNLLPLGAVGELCISGSGVAQGYRNRPDLTAEKFIEREDGVRMYKTGDLGRFLSDGNIELFGRADNQIKLRGFRIEPGEIEILLSRETGVREAVVKLQRFGEGDERLVAYLNTRPEFKLTRDELISHLSQQVPGYMVPSYYKMMDGFPRLPNGKINKKALLYEIEESEPLSETDLNALSETQKRLYNIWCAILKTSSIGVNDDFFNIGGNSLLAIRLVNKIREEFGVKIAFREIRSNSSFSGLADFIDNNISGKDDSFKLVHLPEMTNLPLTANQERLWLISKIDPDMPSYIIPYTFKLTGKLDIDIFRRSLDKLFKRHYVVYSVIKESNGTPYFEIVPKTIDLPVIDLKTQPEGKREERIRKLLDEDSMQVFNLAEGPMFRHWLAVTGAEEYYFHISFHHIIFDGWSWSVFVNDLSAIYHSFLTGAEPYLPELEFQEYDYAKWEHDTRDSERIRKSAEYWKKNLQGCSSVLNFPYDYQRKVQATNRGAHEEIFVPRELTQRLKEISRTEGVSLYTTLLSVYGIELHKYSGEDDLNVGLWVTNRPHSKLENIFGMFVNNVVARLIYSKEQTFRDILRFTHNMTMDAISHQDISFDKVVDIVNPERALNVNPLFQVVFAWQDNLGVPVRLDGIKSTQISNEERTTSFDIILSLWEADGCIHGLLEYNMDLINRNTAIRLKDAFIHVLETFVSAPDLSLAELSVISDNDRKQLAEFNDTGVSMPDCVVHNLFEEQVDRNSRKIAVISEGLQITYKELNSKANQLAHYLISLGVKPGDAIGVSLERTAEMLVTVLGVLKSGCCYLPMDPSFPDDRLIYMFEDSGADILITQNSLKSKFVGISAEKRMILLDAERGKIDRCDSNNPDVVISNQSLAYLIYTSGSTGKPKGVKVHHQAVVNFLLSMKDTPGLTGEDRLLAVTTLSFDISVLELFLPISNGAQVVMASSENIIDGHALYKLLEKYDITVMQATPATWNLMIADGWTGKKNLKALSGGEAIVPSLVKELLARVGTLWNMYGPTETTVWSTCYRITDPEAPIIVGKPINNTTVHILDKNNKELPLGVIGEVAIGGLGVTKGYHNRPELNAEKFLQLDSKGLIYKTGDLGRFLYDGNIELFGRIDNQVKLRGFRIELGEIENQLNKIPEISDAVVKLCEIEENDLRLIAFVVPDARAELSKAKIIESISRELPSYMHPSLFQICKELPRLPNRKVDRKALKFNQSDLLDSEIETNETLSPMESAIYDIWCKILKHENISINDNFFDLGGDSLKAVTMISRIRSEFNVNLPLKIFLKAPRVKELAENVEALMQK